MSEIDVQETQATQRRYDRIAPFYDMMERFSNQSDWHERVWSLVEGPQVLEVGVGTGKNIPYYPVDVHVTGIDLSERMLARARERATEFDKNVTLLEMDAQDMDFADDTFDSAVTTCVYCSVPNPVLGMREMKRVVKLGGRVIMLEHMRAHNEVLGTLMDLVDPLVSRMGPHINRETVDNVHQAGLEVEEIDELDRLGIFRLIVARVPG